MTYIAVLVMSPWFYSVNLSHFSCMSTSNVTLGTIIAIRSMLENDVIQRPIKFLQQVTKANEA